MINSVGESYSGAIGYAKPAFPLRAFILYAGVLLVCVSGIFSVGMVRAFGLVASTPNTPVMHPKQPEAPLPAAAPAVVEPAKPAEPVAMPELQAELEQWIAKHPKAKWSVMVQGVGDDTRTLSINPSQQYQLASLYKVLLLQSLLAKTPWENLSKVSVSVNGTKQKISTCVEKMLRYSDNPCGEAVAGKYIGWRKLRTNLVNAGYKSVLLKNGGLEATPQDVFAYWQNFYSGKFTSQSTIDSVLAILKVQKYRGGIPTGCKGCTVADKTGDYGGYLHDVAVVTDGETIYHLGIFSKGGTYAQIAELAAIIQKHMNN